MLLRIFNLFAIFFKQLWGFAKRGVVFDNALSVIPLPSPSHATIMTGIHPDRHLVFRNSLPMSTPSALMAEYFNPTGCRTAAFISTRLLDAGLGFKLGFDYFWALAEDTRNPCVRDTKRLTLR